MKLGIMQPYFFPYIGYFQLINAVDKWIVFDTVQYMRRHWVNRNRVLHPKSGWQYITVPLVRQPRETLIKDILIANNHDWKNTILAQIEHYKKKAPFYEGTVDFLKECLFSAEARTESLSKLNVNCMKKVCERLGIGFDFSVCSEMGLELGDINEPGDWTLRISELLGAEEYINPPGGRDIYDPVKFCARQINLRFLDPAPSPYNQKGYEFVPGLSIIDVMMWNSADDVSRMIGECCLTD